MIVLVSDSFDLRDYSAALRAALEVHSRELRILSAETRTDARALGQQLDLSTAVFDDLLNRPSPILPTQRTRIRPDPLWGEPDHHGHPILPPVCWFDRNAVPRELRSTAPVLGAHRAAAARTFHRNAGDRRKRQTLANASCRRAA